jgi:hypothetical protein
MAYPNDILLPVNAKIFGFVDTKYPFNSHWDITWSFTFALTGVEHGFTTFLTTNPNILSGYGGQYLGYSNPHYSYPALLTDPGSEQLTDETPNELMFDDALSSINNGSFVIAFDTTGYFALSYGNHPGISPSNVKNNSLIVRNNYNELVFYETLSNISTEFFLSSSTVNFQTLRFRMANSGKKLSIDYKKENELDYKSLTSINIDFDIDDATKVYPGFTFCSPISSLTTPSTMFLKNFHTQGEIKDPNYDIVTYTPLSVNLINQFTTIPSVSASPI